MNKILRPVLLFVLALTSAFCNAQAPNISYATPQTYYIGTAITPLTPTNTGGAVTASVLSTLASSLSNPVSVAFDAAGNVYFVANGSNSVGKIPAGGGSIVAVGSGYNNPTGVAVDGSGNVYVADYANNAVKKIAAGSGTITTYASINSPYGVAFDGSGNLYVTDRSTNTVKKIPAGGGTPVLVASGFNTPTGIAVDGGGNVYVCDRGNNAIKKIDGGGNVTNVATGNGNPNGVAVDAAGNIYFADTNNTFVVEVLQAGGTVNLGSGFAGPAGIAATASGDVYIADSGNAAVKKLTKAGYSINQGLPPGLAFNSSTGVISGTPAGPASTGNYTVTAANSSGTSTATINISVTAPPVPVISYSSPQVYTVGNTITTLSPANSGGPVQPNGYSIAPTLPPGLSFDTNTGNISGTPTAVRSAVNYTVSAVNGTGTGTAVLNIAVNAPPAPIISYSGGSNVFTTTIPITPLTPANTGGPIKQGQASVAQGTVGIGADAAGYIYGINADPDGSSVRRIPLSGGAAVSFASGITIASSLGVDEAGNMFVGKNQDGILNKIPAGGGTPVAFGSGFGATAIIVTDHQGNVYILNTAKKIFKISANGSQTTQLSFTGVVTPSGLAVDAAGNIYISDSGDNTVKKVPANSTVATTLARHIDAVGRICLDAAGNLYVIKNHSTVLRIPADGGSTVAIFRSSDSSNTDISDLVVDAAGNVYFTNGYNGGIRVNTVGNYFITPALPAGLTFDNKTGVIGGTPTAQSPATNYTVTAYNQGGHSSTTVNITVNHYTLPQISYPGPNVYTKNEPVSPPLAPVKANIGAYGGYSNAVIDTALDKVGGVTFDTAGNIYLALYNGIKVVKYPADGSMPVTLATGFRPWGIVADKFNNVYVSDFTHSVIKKIPANGGAIVTIASGLNTPRSMAIDAAGNLYVSVQGGTKIEKIPTNGGSPVTLLPVLAGIENIAVDAAGDIFISEETQDSSGSAVIKKIAADNPSVATILVQQVRPFGLAANSVGDVFFYDYYLGTPNGIKEIPAGTTSVNLIAAISYADPEFFRLAVNDENVIYASGNDLKTYTPTGGIFITKPLPPGLLFDNNTGNISGIPTAVSPATDYTIVAYNQGGPATTTTNIKVSYNVSLSNLTLGTGTLNPAFAQATTSYTATVAYATSSITITPTALQPDAVIKVNGTTVTSGSASGPVALSVGSNAINTVVTSPDGTTSKTYTVTVTRAASNLSTNSTLSTITTTPKATLTTTTGSAYKNYTTTVANSVTSIQVTPTAHDATATITVNGQAVASGALSQAIALSPGANTITIAVTAPDGATIKNYVITATRTPLAIATLSNIALNTGTLTPVFAPATTTYTALVANTKSSITLTPTATDTIATIKVNGTPVHSGGAVTLALAVGNNTITTIVTAEDGTTTKTYTLTVTRAADGASSNAYLSTITTTPTEKLSAGVAAGNEYKHYTIAAPATLTSIQVTPTAQDATARITVNGQPVASGSLSQAVALNTGDNIITVSIMAQNGITVKNYGITVTRATPSNSAVLSSIVTTPKASLTTTTGPGYKNYTASVANSVSSIKITPTAQDATATIKVNGTTVSSGSLSQAIALSVGSSNTITIAVTAQDGVTMKNYIITVTRAPAGMFMKYDESAATPIAAEVAVHQGLSPNGDGHNDVLTIDGIENYPDNNLQIINRSGQLVYLAKGYDNSTKVFDGHASTTGRMQLSGTYFYSLDYKNGNETKHKTGFIVLKY